MCSPFPIHSGVRQGSVLSPVLFLLVMDPILLLQSAQNHMDSESMVFFLVLYLMLMTSACTPSTNLANCKEQKSSVSSFASSSGLILSTEKCEAVISLSVLDSLEGKH